MRENMGHLFLNVVGKPFTSQCVKCGIIVDWQENKRQRTIIPVCPCQYSAKKEMLHILCGSEL